MARGGLQLVKNIRDCRKYLKYLLENQRKLGFSNDDTEQVQWWMEVADNIHADLTYDDSTLEAVYQGILDLSVAHPMPGDNGCPGEDDYEDPWSSGSNAASDDKPGSSNRGETQDQQERLWNPLFQEKQEYGAANFSGVGRGRGRFFASPFAESSWRPSELNPSGNQSGADMKPPLGRGRGRNSDRTASGPTASVRRPDPSAPCIGEQNCVGRSATISPTGTLPTRPGNITPPDHVDTDGNHRSSKRLDPSLNSLGATKENSFVGQNNDESGETVGSFRDPRLSYSRRVSNGTRSDDIRNYPGPSQARSGGSFSNYNVNSTKSGTENYNHNGSDMTSSTYSGQPSSFPGNSHQFTDPPFPNGRQHIADPPFPHGQDHMMELPSFLDDQPGGMCYMSFDAQSTSAHSSHPSSSSSACPGNRRGFRGPPFPNGGHQTIESPLYDGRQPPVSQTFVSARQQFVDPSFTNGHHDIVDAPTFLDDQPGGISYMSFNTQPNQRNFYQRPRGPQHIRPHQPASIKNRAQNFRNLNGQRRLNGSSSHGSSHLRRKSPTRNSRPLGTHENIGKNSHENKKEGDKISKVNTLREEVENAAPSIRQKIRMNLKDIREEIPTALYRLGTKDKNNRVKVPVEEIASKPSLGETSNKKTSVTKKTTASVVERSTVARKACGGRLIKRVRFENDDTSSESSSPVKSVLKVKLPFTTKNLAKQAASSKQKSNLQRKGTTSKSPLRSAATKVKNKQNLQSKFPSAKKSGPRVVYSSDEDHLTPQQPVVPELTINMDSHTYETEKLLPFLAASAVVMRIMDTKENAETCLRNPAKLRDYIQELEENFKDFDQELICPGGFSMPEEEEPTPSHGGRALRPRGIPKQLKLTPAVIVFLQTLYGEYLEMLGTKASSSSSTEPAGGNSKQTLKRKKQDPKIKTKKQKSTNDKGKKSSQSVPAATSSYSIPANIFTGPGLDSIPAATIIADSAFKTVGTEINKPTGEEMEESSSWENNSSFIKLEVKMETEGADGFELPPEVLENLNIEPDSR